ncbi:hypothetical protein LTR47_011849 [Exophiala xenobiotica]|nr:hypothetical protein LTR47_011849 [Exophiala xenobiotica]KAK5548622.1 hypothetical protein LTR46_011953 [Exophiala xenobiotica]
MMWKHMTRSSSVLRLFDDLGEQKREEILSCLVPEVEQDPPDTEYRELLRVPMPSEPLNYESSMTLGDALELSLGADAALGPCLEADERLFAETALAISTHPPDLLDIDMQSSVQWDKEMVRLAEQTLDLWQKCDNNLAAEFFDLSHPEIFVPQQDGIPDSLFYIGHGDTSATRRTDQALQVDHMDMVETAQPGSIAGDLEVDDLDVLFTGF